MEIISTHPRFPRVLWGFHVQSRIRAGSVALGAPAGQTLGRKSKVSVKVDQEERTCELFLKMIELHDPDHVKKKNEARRENNLRKNGGSIELKVFMSSRTLS